MSAHLGCKTSVSKKGFAAVSWTKVETDRKIPWDTKAEAGQGECQEDLIGGAEIWRRYIQVISQKPQNLSKCWLKRFKAVGVVAEFT